MLHRSTWTGLQLGTTARRTEASVHGVTACVPLHLAMDHIILHLKFRKENSWYILGIFLQQVKQKSHIKK